MSGGASDLLIRYGISAVVAVIALVYWFSAGHIVPGLSQTKRWNNPILYWLAIVVAGLVALNGILAAAEILLVTN